MSETIPTPRTDFSLLRYTGGEPVTFPKGINLIVDADFARTLERENAALKAELDSSRKTLIDVNRRYVDALGSANHEVAALKARVEELQDDLSEKAQRVIYVTDRFSELRGALEEIELKGRGNEVWAPTSASKIAKTALARLAPEDKR